MKNISARTRVPDGWSLQPVGEVFAFVKSYAFSRDNLVNGTVEDEGIGNIHYGDIHSTFTSPSIDLSQVSIPTIKDRAFTPKKEDLLKDGDLIMADASEDYEGVGVTVSVHGLKDRKVVGGLHTFVLRDVEGKTDEYYRQYIFRNPKIRNALQKIANGVSVYGISKTALSKVLLPLPPLPEQRRIVSILEIWDKAIDEFTIKIAFKQRIKSDLMRSLLTGIRRLPGFDKPWESVELQNVCKVVMGQSPSSISYNERGDGLPLIQGNNDIKDRKTIARVWTTEITKVANEGDIIMTVRAPVGFIGIATQKVCIGRGVCAISPEKINADFIYQMMEFYESRWKSYEQGSTFTAVNSSDVKALSLKIPTSEVEQIAIAGILKNIERDIQLLNKKLANLQSQKTYLLNALMAGTLRTPEIMTATTEKLPI